MPHITKPDDRDELLRQVRADFIRQGTTLVGWCRSAGVEHSYAYRVLRRETNGPAALALRERLIASSRVIAA